MNNYAELDYFTEQSLIEDPFPYFEYLRSKGPIVRLPYRNVMAVTGMNEALTIINDARNFSSAVAVTGPIPDLPFSPSGDDISEQIEQHRDMFLSNAVIVSKDGNEHFNQRSLINRLFTPTRLKANEAYMWRLANSLIDEFVDNGRCELIADFASPFATLVIADLLGIPEQDKKIFRENLVSIPGGIDGSINYEDHQAQGLGFLFEYFYGYLLERQNALLDDILSELIQANYQDGSRPTVEDLSWLATFLFGAGQDTTGRLLGSALKILSQNPELQERVRADRSLIPSFIDEVVRIAGPVKTANRLAVRTTKVGDVEIPAGTVVSLFYGACNRDPRVFDNPAEFSLGRKNGSSHIGFGRGPHTCAGMPLAKAEVKVALNTMLDRLSDIRLSEEHHGKPESPRFNYENIYVLMALKDLHLKFAS